MAGLGFGVGFFFGSSSPPPRPPLTWAAEDVSSSVWSNVLRWLPFALSYLHTLSLCLYNSNFPPYFSPTAPTRAPQPGHPPFHLFPRVGAFYE